MLGNISCKMKKRLLIIHPTIAPYRIDFFNSLNASFETKICLQFWNLKDQTFDYQNIYDQFEFKPIYLSDSSIFSQCKEICKQINDFKPDIVLTCEFGPITITALLQRMFRKQKFKLVVMTDDSFDMIVAHNDFSLRHRISRSLLASHTDMLVVVSPQVEMWHRQRQRRTIWFPIIVDDRKAVANYKRLLPKSIELAKKYGLSGKRVLLSVSRLVELKNLHRVLDAFAQCKTDATLVVVGDGPERNSLVKHAAELNKEVIFTGRFDGDELYAWYNLASVFILASYQEAFGAVTNEALLAGCRVVISSKAGSSCLVGEDNGEIVDPLNVKNITMAIDRQMEMAALPDMVTARNSMMNCNYESLMKNLIFALYDL